MNAALVDVIDRLKPVLLSDSKRRAEQDWDRPVAGPSPRRPYGVRGETKDVVQIDSSDPSSSEPVMMAVAFAVIAVGTR